MRWFSFFALAPLCACASSTGDARQLDAGFFRGDADVLGDTSVPVRTDAGLYPLPDGGTVRADRFVTRVVSFAPGECAGFGAEKLPDVVLGPPEGGGTSQGGTDVVSLGRLGTIVLGFEPNAIVDGPGPDFVVFENAFYVSGDPKLGIAKDLAEVSVSEDGITWTPFPCMPGAKTASRGRHGHALRPRLRGRRRARESTPCCHRRRATFRRSTIRPAEATPSISQIWG